MPIRRTIARYSIPLPNALSRGITQAEAKSEAEEFVTSGLGPNEHIVGEPTFEEREIPPSWGGREWSWTWLTEIRTEERLAWLRQLAESKGFKLEQWGEGSAVASFDYSLIDQRTNTIVVDRHRGLDFIEDFPAGAEGVH